MVKGWLCRMEVGLAPKAPVTNHRGCETRWGSAQAIRNRILLTGDLQLEQHSQVYSRAASGDKWLLGLNLAFEAGAQRRFVVSLV